MKTISIVIPTFNEEPNIIPLYESIVSCLHNSLQDYSYEILFIDNKSRDNTRNNIEILCGKDKNVKAIFNIKNFGQFSSPYYGITQAKGDCVIMMCADFQDPVEMIPVFINEWEKGNKVICAIKKTSKEKGITYFLRSCYYKAIKKMSNVDQIEHFTGFGLYDRSFVDILRSLDDPTPFLRGIVAEYASDHIEIPYEQQKRRAGKTHNNFFSLYDAAMLSFTSYTKVGLRIATLAGFLASIVAFIITLIYLVMKLIFWERFTAGTTPILIGVFLMGGIQLFFIGLMGEYIMTINSRVIKRPLVIEEKRINFIENK